MLIKKIVSSIVAVAMCMVIFAFPAYATTITQDNLEVNLFTDKKTYNSDEAINATFSVTNNGESVISNVSLEAIVPDGYLLSNDSKELLQSTLKSGDTITLNLVYSPNATKTDDKSNNDVKSVKSPATGDKGITGVLCLLILSGSLVIAIIVSKKKLAHKMYLILLCFATVGMFGNQLNVFAADVERKSVSITETVTVGNKKLDITAVVKYDMKIDSNKKTEADEYYEANSEKIIEVEDVATSSKVLTEKEAVKLMQDRGFTEYPLTYEFTMAGSYVEKSEASLNSNEKHPMYQTFYVSENGDVWTVFIIGETIIANPATYNAESGLNAQLLYAETDTLTSYDDAGNKFYITIPKKSAVILKIVDKVNSEQLNKLIREGLDSHDSR